MLPVSLPVCNKTCYYVFGVVIITRLITSVNIIFHFLFFFYEFPAAASSSSAIAAVWFPKASFFFRDLIQDTFFNGFSPLQSPRCILISAFFFLRSYFRSISFVFRLRRYPESSYSLIRILFPPVFVHSPAPAVSRIFLFSIRDTFSDAFCSFSGSGGILISHSSWSGSIFTPRTAVQGLLRDPEYEFLSNRIHCSNMNDRFIDIQVNTWYNFDKMC